MVSRFFGGTSNGYMSGFSGPIVAPPSGFSDSFTDTNGVLLESHGSGWTKALGAARFEIQSNQLYSNGLGSSANICAYYRPNDGVAAPWIKGDILGNSNYWLMLFVTDNGSQISGYGLRADAGFTNARLYRIDAGALGPLIKSPIAISGANALELRASVGGSQVDFQIFQNGSLVTTASDSTAQRYTAGRLALYHSGGVSSSTSPAFDNVSGSGS